MPPARDRDALPAPDASAPAGSGIDRRTLIRRAAIVGAAAWTAPVVIDSIASPAGAATYTGCYRAQFALSVAGNQTTCSTFTRVTADNGAGCLEPSNWNNVAEFPGTLTLTSVKVTNGGNVNTPATCDYTITLETGTNCSIDERSVARKDQGNSCATGTAGPACQSITIRTTFVPDRFKLLISCDGVICPGGAACSV